MNAEIVLYPGRVHLSFLSPEHLITTFGQLGIALVIFTESFFAFFMPGDSLLFAAGLFAQQGKFGLNIYVLAIACTVGAVAGNQLGYLIGRRAGAALFTGRSGFLGRFLTPEYLEKTTHFFEKHGPKTIVLARFVPVVRTFACIVAGAAKMQYRTFLTYNIVGAVLWCVGILSIGHALGSVLPADFNIDKYLLPLIAVLVVLSFFAPFIEMIRSRKRHPEPMAAGEVADRLTEVEAHTEVK